MRIASNALLLTLTLPFMAQQSPGANPPQKTNEPFELAYRAYRAGRYSEASAQLESLTSRTPSSFEAHELLGLTYAAEGEDAKATAQLRTAVDLQPQSVAARNNLATSLIRTGRSSEAEQEWKQALTLQATDYGATRNLARLYLQQGKMDAALPLLVAAHSLRPEARDNSYDLALAEVLTNDLAAARMQVDRLMLEGDSGELHNLLGQIDEKQGKYVDAADEYSAAAHLDPSDDNLFAWGSELLLHRAYEPAISVFRDATRRFPHSPRLWVGLGMALYSRGEYEPSIHVLLTAADLNAADPRCYLFLSKAYLSSPSQADAVIERFRNYAELKPGDALAQFYYAMSLWKGRRMNASAIDYKAVEALLQRSIQLDGSNAEAHLQLGILYNDQHQYAKELPEYQRALALQPDLADAHYRLGRYFLRGGENAKADVELDRFKQLQAQHQAEVDKERAEVQQFVVATGNAPASQP